MPAVEGLLNRVYQMRLIVHYAIAVFILTIYGGQI